MASVLQGVGAALGWRAHRVLEETDENDSPPPTRSRWKPRASGLSALRRSLRTREALRQVDVNFGETTAWERLETPEKGRQSLQSVCRTAQNALGAVAQRLQKSQRPHGHHLMVSPGKRSPTPRTPRRRGPRPASAAATPPRSGPRRCPPRPRGVEWRCLSTWLGKDGGTLPLRRSQRAAALSSPYSSPAPLLGHQQTGSRLASREFNRDLESVSRGIRDLQYLSQEFDDAIAREERKQAITNYHLLMSRNLQAARKSKKLFQSSLKKLRLN
ncbi:protein PIMREG [Tachyglossus aculeatus]|uniref:protein PIMREG n=1 Tax=Tachyglossus aculeatus TaxID=9261 RepID=UPI0018F47F7C|nr:protein PIMREG [Tachyglossus aculeatus]